MLGPIIKASLDIVNELKAEFSAGLQKTKNAYDLDEEDEERFREEMSKVGQLAEQVMELTG